MSEVESLTLEVLKDIRADLRGLKDEARQTNERLDATNERLDTTNERLGLLERRQTTTETRLATELTAVIGAIRDLKDTLVASLEVKKQVDDHERRLAVLEQRPNP